MTNERMKCQIGFLLEMDRLKHVVRKTPLLDASRLENDAEHSWHMALWAMVMAEYASHKVDMSRVLQMCLVHDVVEIDAGDAPAYDEAAQVGKESREARAARRIFGLLPSDQAQTFQGLWDEFEQGITPEARLALVVDRLQSVFANCYCGGVSWKANGMKLSQAMKRIEPARTAAPQLWELTCSLVRQAAAQGWLAEG